MFAKFHTEKRVAPKSVKKTVFAAVFAFLLCLTAFGGAALAADAFEGEKTPAFNYLILVNYKNPIPDGFLDDLELCEVSKGYYMEKKAAENLAAMLADARKNGLSPVVVSAFRTNAKQRALFNKQIDKQKSRGFTAYADAFSQARRIVACPGTSEHEIGLAADIVSAYYTGLDSNQEKTKEAKWLVKHCAEYGFILRYPKNKTDITEIIYEPWHYRYVGVDAAKAITDGGLCLEEYLQGLSE